MSKIAEAIRQIANGPNHDPFKIFIAQVLTNNECSTTYNFQVGRDVCFDITNLVIAVKVINDPSADESNSDFNNSLPTIYPYVRLMCGVDDGPFNVPKQGSNIIIGINTWGDPFVVQTSAVSFYNNSSMSEDLTASTRSVSNADNGTITLVTANDNTGKATSGSEIRQEKDQITTYVTDSLTIEYAPDGSFTPQALPSNVNAATSIYQNKDKVQILAGANGSNAYNTLYNQDKNKIELSKVGGIDLTVSDKFNVKNNSGDLADVLTKIDSRLSDISKIMNDILSGAQSTSGGGVFTPTLAISIPIDIATLNGNISALSSEISGLLGS